MLARYLIAPAIAVLAMLPRVALAGDDGATKLETDFAATAKPFLATYCAECHSGKEPEADLNLGQYASMSTASQDSIRWDAIIEKLDAAKMPPKKAKRQPTDDERRSAAAWFHAARDYQVQQQAGDPGVVLPHRLSNAEYDYTIRDLTGADIRPTKEFPVDPANPAGFDNSGESLTMSPSLLKKYLEAAHAIADHVVLEPDGMHFAPHAMIAESDRDQYCVMRIIDFYRTQKTDYADYFEAAWRYKHRQTLGEPTATLASIAASRKLSERYLNTIWQALEVDKEEVGPMIMLQAMWRALPTPTAESTHGKSAAEEAAAARTGCQQMRDYVVALRKKVEPRFLNFAAGRIPPFSQPLLIWKNAQYATHRMTFDAAQLQMEGEKRPVVSADHEPDAENEFGPGHTQLIKNADDDPDLLVPTGQREKYEAAFGRFCRIFPDRFLMEERGRHYFDTSIDRGRYLSAGFHSLLGYFRDDQPMYELLLSDDERRKLDALWLDMELIADVSRRTYVQFCSTGQNGEHGIGEHGIKETENLDPDDREVTSDKRIKQLWDSYLKKAKGGDPRGIEAIDQYFGAMQRTIRGAEKARREAEPKQLESLVAFARRAYRRPLAETEKQDLLGYYRSCRGDGLDHEQAIRESVVSILMAPDFLYRVDLLKSGADVAPLSDYELANRLSYFLWGSMPDEELLSHAATGDLHQPAVMTAQAQRMLRSDKVRALAVEFGGNWLDFRRFEEISTVDRDRFPTFTPELRDAMFEEPVRYLTDAFQNDRSLLDLVYGDYTFVNGPLAKHYHMPTPTGGDDRWQRVDGAEKFGRGGLIPMAAFLTKNSPGLRTSPVKRGNWVVRNLLGERIAPPPPNVPQIPKDEKALDLPLRDVLARHRSDANCATCHARFDSLGLVLEGFGPVGERRDKDLAGRPVQLSAPFPDGAGDYADVEGLKRYIREHRQNDLVDNFCGKLLAYALGRSLILSDQQLVKQMREKLSQNEYHLQQAIDAIVTSRQFLNKRGGS